MIKSELEHKSDEDLMELYKMGSSTAFEVIFYRYSGSVLGYLRRRIQKDKEAQDILQDIFLKLHRSRGQYDRTLPFSPWLFSIARSVWLDFLKKKNIEYVEDSEVIESRMNQRELSESKFNVELQGVDLDVLNKLPELQKAAVSLRVVDDATFSEIAFKLSTSPENARKLVSRGLKNLRDLLGIREKE